MRKVLLAVFVCSIAASAMAAAPEMTEDQKTLYFLGQAVSSKIKQFDFTPDETKFIIQGFSGALAGQAEALDEKVYGVKLNDYLKTKQDALVGKEKEKAKPFLEKMSKEAGAAKLASGVVYIPVKEGAGAAPKASDMVKVHYHGTFPDGKVFDSSVDRGTPAEFPLAGVIPCWTEGVQKLKIGGKAKLVCPSDTAYGDKGMPGAIPGGATLVFEVELLDIVKADMPVEAGMPENAPAAETAKPADVKDVKK